MPRSPPLSYGDGWITENPLGWITENPLGRSTICRETGWSARRWRDNADAVGKRSHDGQSRDDRRSKLDLASAGADGVSVAVRICEWESRWSRKFETMQWPAYWSNRIFFLAPIITDFIRNTTRELYDEKIEMLDLEWSKDDDTKTQCNRLNTSPLHRGNASNKCSEDCFYYCSERNNVVVLFWTLKVQSFILTEVSDCGLLIVVTSSTFLKRKDMLKEKSS